MLVHNFRLDGIHLTDLGASCAEQCSLSTLAGVWLTDNWLLLTRPSRSNARSNFLQGMWYDSPLLANGSQLDHLGIEIIRQSHRWDIVERWVLDLNSQL